MVTVIICIALYFAIVAILLGYNDSARTSFAGLEILWPVIPFFWLGSKIPTWISDYKSWKMIRDYRIAEKIAQRKLEERIAESNRRHGNSHINRQY